MNLSKELEKRYLKRYLKGNTPRRLLHNNRINRKIGEERAYPRYRPQKELRAVRISYLIINSVRKMKSTTCLHLKSPLRKRGVERAKLYL